MSLLIVIPCLNEERHLPGLLATLGADPAAKDARIVIADGGSTDRSAEIAREHARRDARIVLLANAARLQSAGINLAVRAHGGDAECFVRVDAHAAYPPDFLTRLLEAQRDSSADTVTVSMRARAEPGRCFQAAVAAAQNSVLGAGGSPHRKGGARRWVDHGHHALFRTTAFNAVGGYDESFGHNEDAEFDARLTAQGRRILLAADILIDYFPRASAGALWRQYFRFGAGRARTVRRHKLGLKPRQLAPALIAPAVAAALLAPVWPPLSYLAAAPMALWLGGSLLYGGVLGLRAWSLCAAAAGVAAAIMHLAWSLGFLSHWFASGPGPAPAAGGSNP